MEPKLCVYLIPMGDDNPFPFPMKITGLTTLIGRHPKNDYHCDALRVSRWHAIVTFVAALGVAYIRDHGSENGTYRWESRIFSDTQLLDGDRIRLGPFSFTVRITADQPEPRRPSEVELSSASEN